MAAQLMVEDVPAAELAERFGTPLFAISETSIRERYRRTLAAVRAVYDPVEVYYAVKSNPILAVRRILAMEGAGGDAFGPGEVETSLRAGVPGEKLVMNGQAKTEEWRRRLAAPGVDHSIGGLFLEVAASDADTARAGHAVVASAIAEDVMPRYFAALAPAPPAAAAKPPEVAVTLVRWPYT